MERDSVKVKADSDSKKVAVYLKDRIMKEGKVIVDAIGSSASWRAVRAITLLGMWLRGEGKDIVIRSYFKSIDEGGKGVSFEVELVGKVLPQEFKK
jgi:stage V sporulation protein SpoVS